MNRQPEQNDRTSIFLTGLWTKLRKVERMQLGENGELAENQAMHRLLYLVDGEAVVTCNHLTNTLKQGDMALFLPGQKLELYADAARRSSLLLLHFDVYEELADDGSSCPIGGANEQADSAPAGSLRLQPALLPISGKLATATASPLCELCLMIEKTWQHAEQSQRIRSQSHFLELFAELVDGWQAQQQDDSLGMLERTRAYMAKNYQEQWTIERLASMAGLNPYYYMHLFKKTYGQSVIDFLTELRINRAKEMLAQSNDRLRDIAKNVGYSDEFYFSRKFKQQTGIAPGIYMKNRRHKIATYHTAITGQLLALQMIPSAAPLDPKWSAYYRQKYAADIPIHLKDVFEHKNWDENREALQHAALDSIICTNYMDEQIKGEVGKLANTLFIPWKETDWRTHLQLIGEFLDRKKEAEQWLVAYDKRVKTAREKICRAVGDETMLMLYLNQGTLYVCGSQRTGSVLYQDLQLRPHPKVETLFAYEQIAPDQLLAYDADRLIVIVKGDPASHRFWQELQRHPQWGELRAVRNKRVYQMSPDPWLEYSAVGHQRIVENMLQLV